MKQNFKDGLPNSNYHFCNGSAQLTLYAALAHSRQEDLSRKRDFCPLTRYKALASSMGQFRSIPEKQSAQVQVAPCWISGLGRGIGFCATVPQVSITSWAQPVSVLLEPHYTLFPPGRSLPVLSGTSWGCYASRTAQAFPMAFSQCCRAIYHAFATL